MNWIACDSAYALCRQEEKMPTESHLKWKQWNDAYAALVNAHDGLNTVQELDPSTEQYNEALARHQAALALYNSASTQL